MAEIQGEDERALDIVRQIRKLAPSMDTSANEESAIERFVNYGIEYALSESQACVALRSRLAEPVITREEIEGMPLVNTLPYPEPAQAVPSEEEDIELIRKALRRYVSPWSSAEEQALDRLRAALTSERANTPTSWRCTRCGATYSTPGSFTPDLDAATLRDVDAIAVRIRKIQADEVSDDGIAFDLIRRGDALVAAYDDERAFLSAAALLRSEPRGEDSAHD